jgi:hypothetical protein
MKFLYGILLGLAGAAMRIFGSRKTLGERLFSSLLRHPLLLIFGLIVGSGAALAAVVLLFTGPHMTRQPKYQALSSVLPGPADGALPIEQTPLWPWGAGYGRPEMPDSATMQAGKRAYVLYCVFCHGENLDGNGPVGESFVPHPMNLRSRKVQSMADTALYGAILTILGMQVVTSSDTIPIFDRFAPPAFRWDIIAYIKSLGSAAGKSVVPSAP